MASSQTVMYALMSLIVLVVMLFAYAEILDAVLDGTCPSGFQNYMARSTATSVCCNQDQDTLATCGAAANYTAMDNLFGNSPYFFINGIIPVFGIVGIFTTLLVLLRALRSQN